MAWFDYLGGLAQGLGQGAATGLQQRQQARELARQTDAEQRAAKLFQRQMDRENREEALAELARVEEPMTQADVEAYVRRGVPANLFRKDTKNPTKFVVGTTVREQAELAQARQALDQDRAWQEMQAPTYASLPFAARAAIQRRAGRPIEEAILSSADRDAYLALSPEAQLKREERASAERLAGARQPRVEPTVAAAVMAGYLNPPTSVDAEIERLQQDLRRTTVLRLREPLEAQLRDLQARRAAEQADARRAYRQTYPQLPDLPQAQPTAGRVRRYNPSTGGLD